MRYVPTKPAPTLKEGLNLIYSACIEKIEKRDLKDWIELFNGPRFDVEDCSEQPAKSNFNKRLGIETLDCKEDVNVDKIWYYIEKLYTYDETAKYRPKSIKYPKSNKSRKGRQVIADSTGLNSFTKIKDNCLPAWYEKGSEGTEGTGIQDESRFKAAAYYTFGILDREDSVSKTYLKKFYKAFGLDKVENVDLVYDSAILLGWIDGLVLLSTYVLLKDKKDEAWVLDKLQLLESFVDEHMKPVNLALAVQNNMLTDVRSFSPRSLSDEGLSMQDFYVQPHFKSQAANCEEPINRLSDNNSTCSLVLSPTGMGKSMYMRMTALRLLTNEYNLIDDLPRDTYVIYIPAYMFSYCYRKAEYKEWTEDLVRLYFNSMIRLAPAINFDKHENRDERLGNRLFDFNGEKIDYYNDSSLRTYTSSLAKRGRLVLLADSFDEIASGRMRQAYLNALKKFKEEYCDQPEAVGAHVIVTSREMGPDTMDSLATSLDLEFASSDVYRIEPLSPEQQKELILNWDRAFPNIGIKDYIDVLDNHYFSDLCKNPYMLSIICRSDGKKINDIIDDLTDTLLLLYTKESADSVMDDNQLVGLLKDSPKKMKRKLQNIAFEALQVTPPHFSKDLLEHQFLDEIKDLELSEDDFDSYREALFEFFTISVGLVVPAEKTDDCWQFISDQFAYELAAGKIINDAANSGLSTNQYYEKTLDIFSDNKIRISLALALICKWDSSRRGDKYTAEEALIKYLVLKDFKSDACFVIQSLVDLALQNYGLNITGKEPNETNREYNHIVNADRMILMRLLSAPGFAPSEAEKKAIRRSNAFKACNGFLNEYQLSLLK